MLESRIMNTMPKDVASDMSWSSSLFHNEVWPIIRPLVGNGDLLQMEGRPDIELANLLDQKSGIDGWHIHKNGMRGIASRVQVSNPRRPYNTFTIRLSRRSGAKTEYEKRSLAISNENCQGWIYPFFTVQAYAASTQGPVISCGIAKTIDLFDYIARGLWDDCLPTREGDAKFYVCDWEMMRRSGYEVWVLRPKYNYFFWEWNLLGLSPQNLQIA